MLEFNRFIFAQRDKYQLESPINRLMQDNFSATQEGETTVGKIRAELPRSAMEGKRETRVETFDKGPLQTAIHLRIRSICWLFEIR